MTVDGAHSRWCRVISGIPQGSILGPLLLIMYINDLSENIHCNIKQYADDTKLYTTVKEDKDILHRPVARKLCYEALLREMWTFSYCGYSANHSPGVVDELIFMVCAWPTFMRGCKIQYN